MTDKMEALREIEQALYETELLLSDYQGEYGMVEEFTDAEAAINYANQASVRMFTQERDNNERVWVVSYIATPSNSYYVPGHIYSGYRKMTREEAEEGVESARRYWDKQKEDKDYQAWVPFVERIA